MNYCILIPTYNNERTVAAVVRHTLELNIPTIVVNDGSTDRTDEVLREMPGFEYVSYSVNRGKGYALRMGMNKALELGYDYAITLDSDGQHDPSDVQKMAEALERESGDVVIMGSRNMSQEGIPSKSSFGNAFSSFWFWAETGIRLNDTQTGFRVYPVRAVCEKSWFTNRFEFEIEVIVRLAWSGIPFREVPVGVEYPEDRVSHFRPFWDFARISVLNTVLFTLALLYHLPKKLFKWSTLKELRAQVHSELKVGKDKPFILGASMGMGIFFGIIPIWGFQMLVGFFVAKVLRLNSVIVLAFSNISIPPFIPFILYFSLLMGKWVLQTETILPPMDDVTLQMAWESALQYVVGASVLAVVAGAAVGLAGYFSALMASRKSV